MALDVKAVYLIKKINCILSYYRWIMETWTDLLISTFCGGNRLPYKTHYFLILTVTLMSIHIQHINVIFFIHNLTHNVWTPNFSRCLNCFYLTWRPSLLYPTAFQILLFSSKNYWAIYIYEPQFCRNDLWFLQGVTNFDWINNVKTSTKIIGPLKLQYLCRILEISVVMFCILGLGLGIGSKNNTDFILIPHPNMVIN